MDAFVGLKHFHLLTVALFLISITVKTILLFTNSEKFDKFREKTKVPEMIITTLFLISGISMLALKGAHVHQLFWVKLALVFAAIPVAIIGYKKKLKIPALLSTVIFIMCWGLAEMSGRQAVVEDVKVDKTQLGTVEHGKQYFQANCVACHGEDGDKGLGGASLLSQSVLTEGNIIKVMTEGRKGMPAFKTMSEEESKAVAMYLQTLRK